MAGFYDDWDAKKRGAPAEATTGAVTSPRDGAPDRGTPTGATTAYGKRALEGELATLALAAEGSRNQTLNDVTFAVYQLVFAGHIDEQEARPAIAEVARRIGLTTTETIATMGSARSAAQVKARREVPDPSDAPARELPIIRWQPPVPLVPWPAVAPGQSEGTEPLENRPRDEPDPNPWDGLYVPRSALGSLPRGEPLIQGVLDRHTYFAVVGRDQSYKSFLVLDWLLCLATGQAWLGHETVRTRALYVVGEGAYGLDDRVTSWEAVHHSGKPVDDGWFAVRRAPLNLYKAEGAFDDLLDRTQREGWGVVVFDTLQRMANGAEQNSAKDAAMIIAALDRVRHVANGSVGVVAHSNKEDRDVRGSSAFEDDADIVWRVKYSRDDNLMTARLDKRKDGPAGLTYDLTPTPVAGTPSLVLQRGGAGVSHEPKPLPPNALKVLLALAEPIFIEDGATFSRIRDHVGIQDGSVSPALNRLMTDGLLKKEGPRKGALYKINSEGLKAVARLQEQHS